MAYDEWKYQNSTRLSAEPIHSRFVSAPFQRPLSIKYAIVFLTNNDLGSGKFDLW